MKKPRTVVVEAPKFGCSEDISSNGKHSPDIWHCFECNDLYAFDREFLNSALGKSYGVTSYSSHNVHYKGRTGFCKRMKNRTFTCDMCTQKFPEFPQVNRTYRSDFGGEVTLTLCIECSGVNDKEIHPRHGPRFVPIWAYLTLLVWFSIFALAILPLLGTTLNVGGFIGFFAAPVYFVLYWKEGSNVPPLPRCVMRYMQ